MNDMQAIQRKDLLFPDLSYQIIGCAFGVYNNIGFGHLEKIYQRALAEKFRMSGIKFIEQYPAEVYFENIKVGKGYLDFLIEEKIIVELKRGIYFSHSEIEQTKQYLSMLNLELGLLIRFTPEGVRHKRVLNIRR